MSAGDITIDIGPNVVVVVGLILPILTLMVNAFIVHRTTQIHGEVKTMNGLRMGELADAAETRRVEAIPVVERTDAEAEHVEIVPPPEESTTPTSPLK